MKTKWYTTIFAVIALMPLTVMGAMAQTEHQNDAQTPMQHDISKMDMSDIMNEPHHVLAMAYMQNIGTFAKILKTQAGSSSPLNAKFAIAVVDEIKRDLTQMVEHHEEHLKIISPEMHTRMAARIKDMETHLSILKDAVSALDNDVRVDQPDSQKVTEGSVTVLKHLDEMLKMHDVKMGKKTL